MKVSVVFIYNVVGNIIMKFFTWLKKLLTKAYKKECIDKTKLLAHLDKNLPNKKMFSVKDIVDKVKELIK